MNPLFDSLQSAASCAVAQADFDLREIKMEHWARTYNSSLEAVRKAFESAQSKISLQPRNCEIPEGK